MSPAATPSIPPAPSFSAPATVVLFDFGGTLDADGVPTVDQFHAEYRRAGGTLDAAAFAPAFRTSDHQLAALPHVATLDYSATIRAQTTLLANVLPDGARIDWSAVAARIVAAAHATAARNRPVLDTLGTHADLGVISNFTGNVHHCLAELGLLDAFATVVDSAVVGHAKPDPEIFRIALRALGASATDALMVGDNPFADVRAAAALGMRTCWVAPAARPVPPGCAPTFRVERVSDLPVAGSASGVVTAPGRSDAGWSGA